MPKPKKIWQGLLWSQRGIIVSADDHCVYRVPVRGLFTTPDAVRAAILSRYPALNIGEIVAQPATASVDVQIIYGELARTKTFDSKQLTVDTLPWYA